MITARSAPTPAELLEPHTRRRVGEFLREHAGDELENAVFDVVYDGLREIPHELATAVDAELDGSRRRIGDVLDGWRPPGIRELADA